MVKGYFLLKQESVTNVFLETQGKFPENLFRKKAAVRFREHLAFILNLIFVKQVLNKSSK